MTIIRYIEICVGLGLGAGPFIGAIVYGYLKYEGTMYLFGVFNLLGMFACVAFVPGILNNTTSVHDDEDFDDEDLESLDTFGFDKEIKITWG